MAQHDYDIANQSGAAFRTDLNNALDAIVTTNSGATEPATTFAFQFWADTTANQLKMRNAANDAWIVILETDGEVPAKTFTGNITLNAQSDVRFGDSDSSNFVSFQAPATVGSDVTFTLPDSDGDANDVLTTDGSGTLSFSTIDTDIRNAAPEQILENTTEEDLDDRRESLITFKGQQSGGEISTLAQIRVSHEGTGDDEKGQIIFKTNDGNDGSSPTSRAVIDSAGHVGIGTTDPGYLLDVQADGGGAAERIRIYNTGTTSDDDAILMIEAESTTAKSQIWFGDSDDNNAGQIRYNHNGNELDFFQDAEVRARIASGKLFVHNTGASGQAVFGTINGSTFANAENNIIVYGDAVNNYVLLRACNTADGTPVFDVLIDNTRRIEIEADGDIYNTNGTYGTISDAKLKENIVDAASQWDDIKALQVRKYNFTEASGLPTDTKIGFIAQEVEEVSPGLIKTNPDLDSDGNDLGTSTKAIKTTILFTKAVKALQEAMERIETLEAKVAALEAA